MITLHANAKSSVLCIFAALLLSFTVLFSPSGMAAEAEAEQLPPSWRQIAESLAENETRYRVTGAIISGLDELINRDEQARIMVYLGLLEEFQSRAENNPEKFEVDRSLGETLDLLEQFRHDYRSEAGSDPDYEIKSAHDRAEREEIQSQLDDLSRGDFSENIDLARLYLDLQEQNYRDYLETLSRLKVGEDEKNGRVFLDLAESLTIYLDDEQDADDIKDEETADLFTSLLQEEIRDDIEPEKIKNTIGGLLDTSEDYAESGSELIGDIEDLREQIR